MEGRKVTIMRPEYDEEVRVKKVVRFRHDCPSAPEGAVEIIEQEAAEERHYGGRKRTFRLREVAELYV